MFDDSSVDELVDRLQEKLPGSRLKQLAKCFRYSKGEGTLRERGADFRRQGYLTRPQASELVRWKTDRQWTSFLHGNSEDEVRRKTESAARCADARPEAPERAAGILNELRAVSYPTASVFLTAWNPREFGILDVRTWRALRALTGMPAFDRRGRTLFRSEEFRLYTRLLRRWSAEEQGTSPRLIDKALWQYDNDLRRGSGRRREESTATARQA